MTPPELTLVDGSAVSAEADALVVGVLQHPDGPALAAGAEDVDAAFDGDLIAVLALVGATGKADEVVKVPTRGTLAAPLLVAAGLGKQDESSAPSAEAVRRASGAAARGLAGTGSAVSTLARLDLAAAAEGSLLGAYQFTAYKSNGNGKEPLARVGLLGRSAGDGAANDRAAILRRAVAVADAVRAARDLVNTPPNDLYPASFADRARELAEAAGVEVDVLDEAALAEGGYGGVLGVGSGSSRPPRLVRLRWTPSGPAPARTVALVGKGVTFDTGGISIKPAQNMDQMTADMSGAAAVIVTTMLAARLGLPITVTATVPMAENMPSATAYRPGDVLRIYGGKTVEVLNTDAEGRLILADAIVRATEDSPDYLVDTATLTGAQIVALGTRTAGVMGTAEFRDRVAGHAQATGEGGWAMPLPDELRADLDSRIADLANVTNHRWGGMLSAGLFLREFVPEGLPWAHVDVAGPAFNTGGPWGYTGKGATGVPVRTLVAVLTDIAENG